MQTAPSADTSAFATYRAQTHHLLDQVSAAEVAALCDVLQAAFEDGKTVWACGNGGSASTASHFIEDLAKLMWDPSSGRRLRCIALTESTPLLTALANDDGYDRIFDIQLAIQASRGDVVICISGSGRSPNVVRAARYAKDHGMQTVAITGYDGGALHELAQVKLHVPSSNMGMLEGVHLLLLDFVSKELRHRIYGRQHHER